MTKLKQPTHIKLIRRSMREAAELLERAGKHRTRGTYGACSILQLNNLNSDPFCSMSRTWSLFSGNITYPVPAPLCASESQLFGTIAAARSMFAGTNNKWSGDYGKLRRELCLFVAASIRRALRVGELIDFRGSNWR